MNLGLGILCYHRIVEDDDERPWPYLERGTAVRRRTWDSHVASISRFADVVSEQSALDVLAGRRRLSRPAVWITFDDGYPDVMGALATVGTGTVFVTTSSWDKPLPADAWYSVLLSARRTRGELDLGLGPFAFDLLIPDGRARLVQGPERRAFLRSDGPRQSEILDCLARQIDAPGANTTLYLGQEELRCLIRKGWSLGSHGVTHTPFDTLDGDAAILEATRSRDTLSSLGPIRSFALPDGVPAHAALVRKAGYGCILGLGNEPCALGRDIQPRFLVPDDPSWPLQVLESCLHECTSE